ncbi:MAG TPA: branched-chain amino acid ABC transporter permease [Planctomycetaceae bacterium]|nr:branched-chain amino acid ABC transporter permease [Planctomycetaceae bacterium]
MEQTSPPPQGLVANVLRGMMPFAVGIIFASLLHFVLPGMIGRYYSRIVTDIGIAIVMAVSLNIVNGMTGQFSIGHAGFMTLGGYTAAFITYYGSMCIWGDTASHGGFLGRGEWLFAVSCLMGGLFAAGAGYVVGLPSLRLRGDYLAIVTLGFGEIIRVILQQTGPLIDSAEALKEGGWSQMIPPPVGGALGFGGVPKYTNLFWVYTILTITIVVAYRLKISSIGRAMISVREDEIAAQAMGVNIARQKVLAFVIAAFFAGVAGGLFAHEPGVIVSPKDAGFQRSFDYVIMTVLGGRGSISGVMLSATILTALPEFLRDFEQYRLIVYALLLIIMMLVRPQGLLGIHEIWNLWPLRRSKVSTATPEAKS